MGSNKLSYAQQTTNLFVSVGERKKEKIRDFITYPSPLNAIYVRLSKKCINKSQLVTFPQMKVNLQKKKKEKQRKAKRNIART